MVLLPGNVEQFKKVVSSRPDQWGWLITPRRPMAKTRWLIQGAKWAADNECFALGDDFDPARYVGFLGRVAQFSASCLFCVAPDVVADAKVTLDKFPEWSETIRALGLPVALAAQDGLEDLDVPWPALDALFIGGSTEWKLSEAARSAVGEAKRCGKWVHVGRVNSAKRLRYSIKIGADSVDGTEWAINPGRGIRWATQVMGHMENQLQLFA